MANQQFLSKAIKRIERIDKESLGQWVVDLTREKHFLTDLLHSVNLGILVITGQLRLAFMNQAAARFLSGAPGAVDQGERIEKIIEDTSVRTLITKTISEDEEMYHEPVEIYTPRYSKLFVTIQRFRPQKEDSGQNDREKNYLILLDSLREENERDYEKYHLERLSSILSLASGIAHEIGNPLNSINVYLGLLLRDARRLREPNRSKIMKSIDVVREETGRLDTIVRNFLRATRRKPIHFQPGNIHDVIRDVVILFEPEFKTNHVKVKTNLDETIPTFFMDTERINQVVINIIKNAVQAMPSGGVLEIRTSANKNICEIAISDTGVGIDSETLPHVFDAYYTTKEEGSGLGLVIAYQIIREHSGRIEMSSKPGEGTTVRILLPVRKEKLQLPSPTTNTVDHDEQFI